MDEQMKKNIVFIIFMIFTGYFFFMTPNQSFKCDKTQNICIEKHTIPLIGKVQKERTIKLSDIKSVRTEYEYYNSTRHSRHGRNTNKSGWRSRLILETATGDSQIFETHNGSNKIFKDECFKIKQFLASNEQILDIKYSNTAVHIVSVIIFLAVCYGLFRKSE